MLTKFALLRPCISGTIVHCVIQNSQYHKTLKSFINTGHFLLLKYYIYLSISIEPKIGKYRVSKIFNTAIIDNRLITTPNACSYFYFAGQKKSYSGMYIGQPCYRPLKCGS